MTFSRSLGPHYSPLYFLNAAAAGSVALSFLIYLAAAVARKGLYVPTCMTLFESFKEGDFIRMPLILIGAASFLFFGYQFIQLLRWNLRQLTAWKATETYDTFQKSPLRLHSMAIPLTLALGANLVLFFLLSFIPYFWVARDFLLPLLLLGGLWAGAKVFLHYLQAYFENPDQDLLGQLLAALAFGAIGFTLAAAAAYADFTPTAVFGFFAGLVFALPAAYLGGKVFLGGFRSFWAGRKPRETMPALCLGLSLLILLALDYHRLHLGLTSFARTSSMAGPAFLFWSVLLVASALWGGLLAALSQRQDGVKEWTQGAPFSVGTYSFVIALCAALFAAHHLINEGFVRAGLFEALSWGYGLLYLPLIAVQVYAVKLLGKLNATLFAPKAKTPSAK